MGEEQRKTERRVLLVVVAAACAALLTLMALGLSIGAPSGLELALAGLLAPLVAVGRLFPIQVAFRRRMVTDTAPLFAAALLVSPLAAGFVAASAIALAETVTGRRGSFDPRQVLFNASQSLLGTVAAALAFQRVSGAELPSDSGSVMWGVGAAALSMLAVNDLLVFSVVWAQTGLRFQRMVGDFVRGRTDLPHDIALYGVGFVGAIAGSMQPWLLLLLAVPLPVLYRTMQAQVALRLQTRDACIAFADIVDARDAYTFGHCQRVADFSEAICRELGLPHDMTDEISLAARIHDLGKIGIRDNVLLKPARLDRGEFFHMMEHAEIGARLTAFLPEFKKGTTYIRHHHEKWDGSGYPAGLKGEAIPLGARIIAVADTYDAITSSRVYREGQDDDFARREMARAANIQHDPEISRAWFRVQSWAWPDATEAELTFERSIVNETIAAA